MTRPIDSNELTSRLKSIAASALCRGFAHWLILTVFLTGCGASWGTVQGTATLDDRPLDKGQVVFNPVEVGAAGYGSILPGGRFAIDTGDRVGLKAGDYVATVTVQSIPEEGKGQAARLLTPDKYASREKSDLRVTFRSGVNEVRLKLTSK